MVVNPLGSGDVKHRDRFPPIEPFDTGMLRVSELHLIYYEQCGLPEGIAVVHLHGGPGGNVEAVDRQLFDPKVYRCILFDQRGCGRSLPLGETNENDTWHLVNDIERLREHLKIDRWVVYGGSWGSLLALVYAIKHPIALRGMLIWGINFCAKEEFDWLVGANGAARLLPDYYEEFAGMIPPEERNDMVEAYRKRVNSQDRVKAKRFAEAWGLWEGRACKTEIPEPKKNDESETCRDGAKGDAGDVEADGMIAIAKMETLYFVNEAFIHNRGRNFVMDNIGNLKSGKFPVIVVQGRNDLVCVSENAWKLKKAWPEVDLRFIPDGIHSSVLPSMQDALLNALDELAQNV